MVSETTLKQEYVEREKSFERIAEEYDSHPWTIWELAQEYGIETRTISESLSNGDLAKLADYEYLHTEYVKNERSMKDIASELGLSDNTVHNWLRKHGIPTRKSLVELSDAKSDLLRDESYLRDRYHGDGMTLRELGDELNCSRTTVHYWLRKHDIETKKPGTSGKENPNWKPIPRADCFFGRNWKEQRPKAYLRDQARCQRCGVTEPEHKDEFGSMVEVHHINPRSEYIDENGVMDYEAANSLDNLITLCKRCHKTVESWPIAVDC